MTTSQYSKESLIPTFAGMENETGMMCPPCHPKPRLRLLDVIDTLPDYPRWVLIHRFGLLDGVVKTLGEVAAMRGVGRERIRQVEAKGLRMLRHPRRILMLAELAQDFGVALHGFLDDGTPTFCFRSFHSANRSLTVDQILNVTRVLLKKNHYYREA